MVKDKLVLHACCAPCAGHVIERLEQDYNLIIYFFNPNIYPEEEYLRRRDELKNYCLKFSIPFIEGSYRYQEWDDHIKGLEQEPEKGRRCDQCFRFRLEETALYAVSQNYQCFTTTLTISPHKLSTRILEIGKEIAARHQVHFLPENFKKKQGYQLTTEIAKREGFYRQTYCGCYYSK